MADFEKKMLERFNPPSESGKKNQRVKMPSLKSEIASILAKPIDGVNTLSYIVGMLVRKSLDGDLEATKILLDRGYGRPSQHIDHTSDGEAINTITWVEAPQRKDAGK